MSKSEPKISDFGEFALIERIRKILPQQVDANLIIGLGDDTAVIRLNGNRALLVTCDIQIEDRHFRLKHITPYQLGKRAIAVNLSDIAAMGGVPRYALVSLGLPHHFALQAYDDLFKGMRDQLADHSALIIGGNLARSEKKLIVDISLLGEVSPENLLTRSGAKAGDRIFVTGELGASGAGFYVLEKFEKNVREEHQHFIRAHLEPTPRVEIGRQIAASGIATAMIDISDGIASDLFHICVMSKVGAEINEDRLPLPEDIWEIEPIAGKDVLQLALYNGEDYELLFTVPKEVPVTALESISQDTAVPITEIGRIVPEQDGYYLIDAHHKRIPLQPRGWDHFQKFGQQKGRNTE